MAHINGCSNNNYVRLKGTDFKFETINLIGLKCTDQNKSIFKALDSNNNGVLEQNEIDALFDAAGNSVFSSREAKKAGIDFAALEKFVKERFNGSTSEAAEVSTISPSNIEQEGEHIDNMNSKYTVTHNQDGGYTRTYEDGRIRNYDKDGKWVSGEAKNGITYTNSYVEDGSIVSTLSNGDIQNYDSDGKHISGKLANGTTYTISYGEDGTSISEFSKSDGSKYYYSNDEYGKSTDKFAQRTVNGDVKADAINGETFNATMKRLGITNPEDQDAFRKANPKAAKRGYFKVGMHDVIIPKAVADKLDMNSILVDSKVQVAAWKQAVKAT